jgi:hypothetical protein
MQESAGGVKGMEHRACGDDRESNLTAIVESYSK